MTHSSSQGCSISHPTWPWTTLQGFAASLKNLCQSLTIFTAENCFLIDNVNLASFTLRKFLFILSLHPHLKRPSPTFLYSLFRHWMFGNIKRSNVWKSCVYYLNFLYMCYGWTILKIHLYWAIDLYFLTSCHYNVASTDCGFFIFTSITLKISGIHLLCIPTSILSASSPNNNIYNFIC